MDNVIYLVLGIVILAAVAYAEMPEPELEPLEQRCKWENRVAELYIDLHDDFNPSSGCNTTVFIFPEEPWKNLEVQRLTAIGRVPPGISYEDFVNADERKISFGSNYDNLEEVNYTTNLMDDYIWSKIFFVEFDGFFGSGTTIAQACFSDDEIQENRYVKFEKFFVEYKVKPANC